VSIARNRGFFGTIKAAEERGFRGKVKARDELGARRSSVTLSVQ
jgi:hypothetical protein